MRELSIPKSNEKCDCPKSGAWLTRIAAKGKLKAITKKSTRGRKPVRVYECEDGIFHLTSQTWEERERKL